MDVLQALKTRNTLMEPKMSNTLMEPKMTVRDVMAVTRFCRSKIYQLKDQGILPALKLPGCNKVLFDPADVRRYLEAGRVASFSPSR